MKDDTPPRQKVDNADVGQDGVICRHPKETDSDAQLRMMGVGRKGVKPSAETMNKAKTDGSGTKNNAGKGGTVQWMGEGTNEGPKNDSK